MCDQNCQQSLLDEQKTTVIISLTSNYVFTVILGFMLIRLLKKSCRGHDKQQVSNSLKLIIVYTAVQAAYLLQQGIVNTIVIANGNPLQNPFKVYVDNGDTTTPALTEYTMYVGLQGYTGQAMQGIIFVANWSLSILYLFTAYAVQFSLRWEEIMIRNLGVPLASGDQGKAEESLALDNYGVLLKAMNKELDSKKKTFRKVNLTWVLGTGTMITFTILQLVALGKWGDKIYVFCIIPFLCILAIMAVLVIALRSFNTTKKVNVVKFNLCQVFLQFIFMFCSLLVQILQKVSVIILFNLAGEGNVSPQRYESHMLTVNRVKLTQDIATIIQSIFLCLIVEALCRSIEQFTKPATVPNEQSTTSHNALTRVDQFCKHYVNGLKAEMSREMREAPNLDSSSPHAADQSSRVIETSEPGHTTFNSALLSSEADSYEKNPMTLFSVLKKTNQLTGRISGLQIALASNLCTQIGQKQDPEVMRNLNTTFTRAHNLTAEGIQRSESKNKDKKSGMSFVQTNQKNLNYRSLDTGNNSLLFNSQVNRQLLQISDQETKDKMDSSETKDKMDQTNMANNSDFLSYDPAVEVEHISRGNGQIKTFQNEKGLGGVTIKESNGPQVENVFYYQTGVSQRGGQKRNIIQPFQALGSAELDLSQQSPNFESDSVSDNKHSSGGLVSLSRFGGAAGEAPFQESVFAADSQKAEVRSQIFEQLDETCINQQSNLLDDVNASRNRQINNYTQLNRFSLNRSQIGEDESSRLLEDAADMTVNNATMIFSHGQHNAHQQRRVQGVNQTQFGDVTADATMMFQADTSNGGMINYEGRRMNVANSSNIFDNSMIDRTMVAHTPLTMEDEQQIGDLDDAVVMRPLSSGQNSSHQSGTALDLTRTISGESQESYEDVLSGLQAIAPHFGGKA